MERIGDRVELEQFVQFLLQSRAFREVALVERLCRRGSYVRIQVGQAADAAVAAGQGAVEEIIVVALKHDEIGEFRAHRVDQLAGVRKARHRVLQACDIFMLFQKAHQKIRGNVAAGRRREIVQKDVAADVLRAQIVIAFHLLRRQPEIVRRHDDHRVRAFLQHLVGEIDGRLQPRAAGADDHLRLALQFRDRQIRQLLLLRVAHVGEFADAAHDDQAFDAACQHVLVDVLLRFRIQISVLVETGDRRTVIYRFLHYSLTS